ncbi:hypothetical protein JCM19231_1519 [Vibrio ishigakensis]|uniref:Outer membrane protein beta-barrel domain-containing protein n=1 Tax=Vibrio ishigakensis TaxID=1481914 RepID=A0A0B8P2P0_9VIBR|nr:hypothetical protein [Vibrio ishigakensis]GAM57578.1 hypothetical protein JCM19231_1519 [Vibrio ishigakensis]
MKRSLLLLALFSTAIQAEETKEYNWHIHTGLSDSSQVEGVIVGAGYSGDIFGAEFNYHILDDGAKFDANGMYEFNVEAGYKIKLNRLQFKPYVFIGKSILNGPNVQGQRFDDAYQYGAGIKGNLGLIYADLRYNNLNINTYDPTNANNRGDINEEYVQFHLGVTF